MLVTKLCCDFNNVNNWSPTSKIRHQHLKVVTNIGHQHQKASEKTLE